MITGFLYSILLDLQLGIANRTLLSKQMNRNYLSLPTGIHQQEELGLTIEYCTLLPVLACNIKFLKHIRHI